MYTDEGHATAAAWGNTAREMLVRPRLPLVVEWWLLGGPFFGGGIFSAVGFAKRGYEYILKRGGVVVVGKKVWVQCKGSRVNKREPMPSPALVSGM